MKARASRTPPAVPLATQGDREQLGFFRLPRWRACVIPWRRSTLRSDLWELASQIDRPYEILVTLHGSRGRRIAAVDGS